MKRVGIHCLAVVLLVSALPRLAAAEPTDSRSEYGVTLAITGEEARAESIFVTMLSHTHGDARALNNLGNLRLLRGETGVALAFYERALRGDSLDAGIHLNRATALMLLGDKPRSEQAFAVGVKLAGSVEKAQALLGIPPEKQQPTEKAAQKTMIDPEQLRAMLKQAAATVPTDSSHTANAATGSASGKHPSAWRSAGARASDGSGTPQLLYWKR